MYACYRYYMNRMIYLIIGVVLVLAGFAYLLYPNMDVDTVLQEVIVHAGNRDVSFQVEIADTDLERRGGLMFRESLDQDKGMLFIFDSESMLTFWMKNTLIPIDIIFINSGLEIVSIEEAVPCQEDPCPIYGSGEPSLYVLEINKGLSQELEITPGNRVTLPELSL